MAERAHDAKRRKINKPPVLFDQTQQLIRAVQAELGAMFLAYWNSPNGSVCNNDVIGFYEMLRQVGRQDVLYLFIKSDGGDGTSSLRIIHLLRQYAEKLVAVAPLNCVSAATMLALGADEIQMGPLAHLSAVDTSIRHDLSPIDVDNERVSVSQDELARIVNLWRLQARGGDANPYQALFQHVHPLVIGAVDRSSSLSIQLCKEILSYHMADEERADAIASHLNAGYPSHVYPVTLKEAERIGLNAVPLDEKINEQLIRLNELYSEMGQRALTDFDEANYHNNEILNIIEGPGSQLYYQIDKDWHYRSEERRWVGLNDESSWRKTQLGDDGRVHHSVFHIR